MAPHDRECGVEHAILDRRLDPRPWHRGPMSSSRCGRRRRPLPLQHQCCMSVADVIQSPAGTPAWGRLMSCFYCDKAAGLAEPNPIGGWIFQDDRWLVNHVKPEAGATGTLIASSRRHA